LLPPGVALFLDGGHNENAGEAIATWLRSGPAPVDAVVGMRGNKAVRPFLTHLAPYLRRLRAVPIPGDSFTMAPEAIVEAGREAGIQDASAAASVAAAISDLARVADLPRRLLICGSLYLAGTVLAEIPPE
jgi:dihydrofolate synthase/folylpolyglutamate synthase